MLIKDGAHESSSNPGLGKELIRQYNGLDAGHGSHRTVYPCNIEVDHVENDGGEHRQARNGVDL